jgi:hypothetical protein
MKPPGTTLKQIAKGLPTTHIWLTHTTCTRRNTLSTPARDKQRQSNEVRCTFAGRHTRAEHAQSADSTRRPPRNDPRSTGAIRGDVYFALIGL